MKNTQASGFEQIEHSPVERREGSMEQQAARPHTLEAESREVHRQLEQLANTSVVPVDAVQVREREPSRAPDVAAQAA